MSGFDRSTEYFSLSSSMCQSAPSDDLKAARVETDATKLQPIRISQVRAQCARTLYN